MYKEINGLYVICAPSWEVVQYAFPSKHMSMCELSRLEFWLCFSWERFRLLRTSMVIVCGPNGLLVAKCDGQNKTCRFEVEIAAVGGSPHR